MTHDERQIAMGLYHTEVRPVLDAIRSLPSLLGASRVVR